MKLETQPVWGEIAPLAVGTPIPELARRFDVSAGDIAAAIVRSGLRRRPVPAPNAEVPPPADPADREDAPSDAEAPRRASRKGKRTQPRSAKKNESAPKIRRGGFASPIDAHAHLLGAVPDSELATLAGVSRAAVYQYRRHRKIPAFKGPETTVGAPKAPQKLAVREPAPAHRGSTSILDQHLDLLGALPDAEVARRVGLSRAGVSKYRQRRGIRAFQEDNQSAPVERAQAPTPSPASSGTVRFAFTVVARTGDGERSYAVTGADIAEAAAKAAAAIGHRGEVVSVVRYLESL